MMDTILEAIGQTPLVRLHKVTADINCDVYAKCEFMNPGGSTKDRIALNMIKQAEQDGKIKPGDTLIEPTSGNTGLGLALIGAVRGYHVIVVMPEKMSQEKQVVLEALGAEIIRTPTEATYDDPKSHISVAIRLQKELPRAHILDQYTNLANPKAHYEFTAQEILKELKHIDMAVIGVGTGGVITGVGHKLKEANPHCEIIGVDPVGSILAGGSKKDVASYQVEGIGYDFIPDVLNRNVVSKWVKTTDTQSFLLARRLIKEEGLLCGGSSGAVLFAVLQEAKRLKKGQTCVCILADGVRNYLTKFVDDQWLKQHQHTQ